VSKKNIPPLISTRIKEYSERLGVAEEALLSQLIDYYNEDKERYPKTAWDRAIRRLRGELKRKGMMYQSRAIPFKGVVLGSTRLLDFIEIMKNKALALFNNPETREMAIQKHYITPDGVPLDTREKVDFQDNPNYLQPFREGEHSWYRVLFGIARPLNSDDTKFFLLRFRGDKAKDLIFSYNTWYLFRATMGNEENYYALNATKATELTEIDPEDIDIEDAIYNCGLPIHSLKDIENLWEIRGDEREPPVLIETEVSQINTDFNPKTKNRVLILDSQDMPFDFEGVRCFIDHLYPINFKEDTTVVVIGTLTQLENRDGSKQIAVNGYGLVPLKEFLRE